MADSLPSFASFGYLLCFCVLLFSSYCVYGARELANHQHVNKHNSLMPAAASTCSASTTSKGLQIAHRYGPCSPLAQQNPPPTSREILLRDQSRVRSLYSTSSTDETGTGADLPLQENSVGAGNFVVKVGFGTPKRDLTLMFDTGSDMTWIQCLPCSKCYVQDEPIFDPSKSSTFSDNPSCITSTCPPYSVAYHDDSYTSGNYVKDTLTLSSDSVIPDFVFGCGNNNGGDFGKVAGILGVGQGDTSVMSQTVSSFGQQFCYCLPLTETSTGFLRFGLEAFNTCPPEISIPLITESHRYYVNLVAITIGQKRLEMSANVGSGSLPRTIIDSGTIISRLTTSLYSDLRSAFQDSMSEYPAVVDQSQKPMDTCYNLTGFGGDVDTIVPSMVLHFGDSKDLNLAPSAVVWKDSNSQTVCLAFAGNEKSDDLNIIGNHQQRNVRISYSIFDKQVGFSTVGCGN